MTKEKLIFPESADIKLKFGKYKNKSLKNIYQKDPKYMDWLEKLDTLFDIYKEAISDIRWYEEQKELKLIDKTIIDIKKSIKKNETVYRRDLDAVGVEWIIDGLVVGECCGDQRWINKVNIKKNRDKFKELIEIIYNQFKENGCTLEHNSIAPKEKI